MLNTQKCQDYNKHQEYYLLVVNTTTTCVRHRVSKWLVSLIWSIHLVISARKCIEKACRKLITYKLENGIPWLFTGFANIEIPRLLIRMPRLWDWADIFRDALFSIDHSIPLNIKDFPWLFKKFPDLEKFVFPLTFPWLWQPCWRLLEKST